MTKRKKIGRGIAIGLVTLVLMIGIFAPFFGMTTLRLDEDGEEDEIKVACVGNSITYGLLVFNWYANAYPKQLTSLLGKGYWVKNFGHSARTGMKTGDHPYTDTDTYQESLAFAPDIVVLKLGSNDAKDINWKGAAEFKKQYGQLIATYQALASKPKIYLCTPAKAFKPATKPDDIQNKYIDQVVTVDYELAQEKGLKLIDINRLTAAHPEWFTLDGIHPNAAGATGIAQAVYQAIKP